MAFSQDTQEYKGNIYIKKNNHWYTENNYEVNQNVLTIKLKKEVSLENYKIPAKILRVNSLGFIDVEVPETMGIFQLVEIFKRDVNIESIDINTMGTYTEIPNDVEVPNQWYLDQIHMQDAWDFSFGQNTITVAIIDSGVDWRHEDIGLGNDNYQNLWLNNGEDAWADPSDPTTGNGIDDDGNGFIDDWKAWNFPLNSNNNLPSIVHGTRVAGIVSAKTNNSIGIAGIAGGNGTEGVKLMNLIAGMTNPDASLLDDNILYAIEQGAHVIQLSLSVAQTNAIDAAIQSAIDNNIVIICASGNGNEQVSYPASNANVIAVGATNENDERADFSNFGNNLTLSAPGVNIFSSVFNNSYSSSNGTSFAAPIVSGVVALMLSIDPTLTPATIRNILISEADKVGGYSYINGRSNELGFGRINAYRSIMALSPPYISGPYYVCNNSSTFIINNYPVGSTTTWSTSSNIQIISFSNSEITVKPINTSTRGLGQITYVLNGGNSNSSFTEEVYVGKPGIPSYIFGPSTVLTGAIVNYQGGIAEGATSYEWRLPYPFTTVTNFNHSGQDWQLEAPGNTRYAKAFTGYAKTNGYVQVMGVNACGTGGAKLLYVSHDSGGGGAIAGIDEPTDDTKEVVIYPNPASNRVNVRLSKLTEYEGEPPTKILSIKVLDQNSRERKSYNYNGHITEVEINVAFLSRGLNFLIIITDQGSFTKKLLIE
jgi:subtilisin family serine protease